MKKQNETAEIFQKLEMVFRNGEEIKGYVFTLVGVWAASLNYDYYTTEYFPAESCDPIDSDPTIIRDKRNAFIENELEGLGEEIQKIKTTLELYHINTNPRNISSALETIFNSGEQYLQNLKDWTDNKSHARRTASILHHFESVELDELVYYLSYIYLDLLKVREFLLSKIEKTHKISEVQTTEKRLKKTKNQSINSFGFSKENKIPGLLYNELSDNEIISDSVNKEDFIKGITSDWKTTNVKIKIVNTTLFAFLISELKDSKIKSYFDNFTFANVGKSDIFFTEETDYIRPNTLSSSKRSARENGSKSKYIAKSQLIISNLSSSLFPEK
tara:strand:+ start:234 stop:1223 length:990 start_codon:yes stop_codon:yes gene_type:complete